MYVRTSSESCSPFVFNASQFRHQRLWYVLTLNSFRVLIILLVNLFCNILIFWHMSVRMQSRVSWACCYCQFCGGKLVPVSTYIHHIHKQLRACFTVSMCMCEWADPKHVDIKFLLFFWQRSTVAQNLMHTMCLVELTRHVPIVLSLKCEMSPIEICSHFL